LERRLLLSRNVRLAGSVRGALRCLQRCALQDSAISLRMGARLFRVVPVRSAAAYLLD
jgi:hypothetical protein